jgi:serine protease Do
MQRTMIPTAGLRFIPILAVVLFVFNATAGPPRSASLGIMVEKLTFDDRRELNADFGALVSDVSEDSPADRAGIKAGDVIVKVGGEKVTEPEDVTKILSEREEGGKVEIVLLRKGVKQTVRAEPAERGSGLRFDNPEAGGMNRDNQDFSAPPSDKSKVDPQIQELPEKILDSAIRGEMDDDIRAKLKGEMEKLNGDADRDYAGKIKELDNAAKKL